MTESGDRWDGEDVRAYDVATVRAAERAAMAALPDGALMQRAAAGLASVVVRLLTERGPGGRVYGSRVLILVGAGDNGGDALWAGARLARRGARVDAVLTASRVHAEGLAALRAAGGQAHRGVDAALMAAADLVVDGMLGIGGRPGLRGEQAELAERVALLPDDVPVVAVDLPSGVAADSGEIAGPHIVASHTVTFGVAKPCLVLPPACQAAGRVELVDIGLGPHLPTGSRPAAVRAGARTLARRWPVPGPGDDKYRRGVVGVVAGGDRYPGAAVLSTGAAVRSGAGMVRYVGPAAATSAVLARWPEVVPGHGQVQAWLVGPGLAAATAADDLGRGAQGVAGASTDAGQDGPADEQEAAVRRVLAGDLPCVVDAGALPLLSAPRAAPTLLTPHAGELARLLTAWGHGTDRAEVEARPRWHAGLAAEVTGATVLLKGATTLVVTPDARVRVGAAAPHWIATAGSGDVLAGVAATLLAAGLSPLDAGELAVAVHSRAGWIAGGAGPLSAEMLLDALAASVTSVLRGATERDRGRGLRHWTA